MGATSMVRGGVTRFLPGFRRESGRQRLDFTSYVEQPETGFGDVEFDFLDVGEMSLAKSGSSDEFQWDEMELDEDDGERVDSGSVEENRSFWENQHQVLQTNLFRTSSLESRIRNATKESIQDIQNAETVCSCSTQVAASSCRNCLMREVSRQLQKAGYNSAICKTKWKSSPSIPSGEHTFLDVIDSTSKKQDVRVIIEVNFKAEFEMGRASEDYNRLVRRLPEVYVGKVERLNNIIKVLCMGAKRCMKENKMHMGPWRKHKYMQAKWLGPCKRNTSTASLSMGYSEVMPKPKPRASLLTVDMLEKLPNMHRTAVEVL
ncbi:uncharacterized protein LOC113858546 [Abrus precatorius]|uniref:Uncharacterized protein LOC113858546 n=1 Tax=Abrus precatorius TaxID=3816 RepID=A0A8B8KX44_ABRPR|nr:uncharacterized protein LOC113858546 [Abrus precatorius]